MDEIQIIKVNCKALITSTKEHDAFGDVYELAQNLLDLVNGKSGPVTVTEIGYLCKAVGTTYGANHFATSMVSRAPVAEIESAGTRLEQMTQDQVAAMVALHLPQDAEKKPTTVGKGVFVGYGHSELYHRVLTFLSDDFGIQGHTFEKNKVGGGQVIPILTKMLDECGFAIIVATAEDASDDGLRARQNVVHETGLFQGRLGFERVAILKQKPVTVYSNLAGLLDFPFDGDNISATFHDVSKQLRSFGYKHV